MKPSAIVVNACRGPVVDEAALIRALDTGQIAGAGLDVTEIEPIEISNALIGRDNVVLLPHRAGSSVEAREKSIDNAVQNAKLLMAGEDPVGVVLPVWLGIVIILVVIGWLIILITGSFPKGFHDFIVGSNRWSLRVAAYMLILTTDE
jgi:hypothetical protein